MKATAAQKIKTGLFTISGILVLVAGIFIIGHQRHIFGDTYCIHGFFRNIGGLMIGNNVRFDGINIGSVEGIHIENDSTVRVTMVLKTKVQPFLKTDALASIGTDGLMGDKLINISPGSASRKPIEDGGIITTLAPVDFDKIINRIGHITDNAETITTSLANIASQINSGKGSIGRLIYSDSLEKGLEKTVNNAHRTISSMHKTISNVDKTITTAQETVQSAKEGVEGFKENMEAAKHNIFLKHYFRKKARRENKARQDSLARQH